MVQLSAKSLAETDGFNFDYILIVTCCFFKNLTK